MEDLEFSAEFCEFIQAAIPSVDAAELLLVFHSKPEAAMTVDEAAARLGPGIDFGQIRRHLETFESKGLLARQDGRYKYLPASPFAGLAGKLSQAYSTRPVTLVRIIYALRDSSIRSFADAFRVRKG